MMGYIKYDVCEIVMSGVQIRPIDNRFESKYKSRAIFVLKVLLVTIYWIVPLGLK